MVQKKSIIFVFLQPWTKIEAVLCTIYIFKKIISLIYNFFLIYLFKSVNIKYFPNKKTTPLKNNK